MLAFAAWVKTQGTVNASGTTTDATSHRSKCIDLGPATPSAVHRDRRPVIVVFPDA
jgi:hypothetical protein